MKPGNLYRIEPLRDIDRVILNAVGKQEFRDALVADVEGFLARENFSLSPEELKALKDMKPEEWDSLTVKELDSRLAKQASGGRPMVCAWCSV